MGTGEYWVGIVLGRNHFSVSTVILLLLLAHLVGSAAWAANPEPIRFQHACEPGTQVQIGAVGDFLMHGPIQKKASMGGGFTALWKRWIPYMKQVDQMYGNLETPTAPGMLPGGKVIQDPGNVFDNRVHTGFPNFNVYAGIIPDLQASGFDVVSTANNHALDRGQKGIDSSIDELEKNGLPFSGTRRVGEKRDWSVTLVSKGIRISWIACTAILNVPDKAEQILHCERDWYQVAQSIQRLRKTSDVVIVTPHWGIEERLQENSFQRRFARAFLDAGATAVIGTHPHVVQPMEYYKTKDGRESFIIYSTGNFTTNNPKIPLRTSIFLTLGFTKNANGETFINGVKFIPTYVNDGSGSQRNEVIALGKDSEGHEAQGLKIIDQVLPDENRLAFGESLLTNPECH